MKNYRVLVKIEPNDITYIMQERNVVMTIPTPWRVVKGYNTLQEANNVIMLVKTETDKMMGNYFEDGVQFTEQELKIRHAKLREAFEEKFFTPEADKSETMLNKFTSKSYQTITNLTTRVPLPAMPTLSSLPSVKLFKTKKPLEFYSAEVLEEHKEYKIEISQDSKDLPFKCFMRTQIIGQKNNDVWELVGSATKYESAKKIGEDLGATYTDTIVSHHEKQLATIPQPRKMKKRSPVITSTDESSSEQDISTNAPLDDETDHSVQVEQIEQPVTIENINSETETSDQDTKFLDEFESDIEIMNVKADLKRMVQNQEMTPGKAQTVLNAYRFTC